jgi:CheY-like chemotaxis protein
MGGEINVASTPGGGSVFSFKIRLPQVQQATSPTTLVDDAQGQEAEKALSSEFPNCRVLVAEDDWVNQEVVLELLREILGFHVDLAPNGADALDLALQRRYELILMDIQMPELDGLAATQAIREIPGYTTVPIIAMTANAFAEDRNQCLDAGMNDFIAKPVDPDELFVMMLKWLRTSQPSPSSNN